MVTFDYLHTIRLLMTTTRFLMNWSATLSAVPRLVATPTNTVWPSPRKVRAKVVEQGLLLFMFYSQSQIVY